MTRSLVLFLLTVAVAALPLSLRASGDEAHVQFTRAGDLSGGEPAAETFEVTSPMKTLKVELGLRLEEGAATWQLTDPDGEVAWEGRRGSGDHDPAATTLKAAPGEWTLTLTPDAADGSYILRWRGDS